MSKEIQELKDRLLRMERTYEEALLSEGETAIAYKEGFMDGLKRAIEVLESMEEA